MHKKSLGERISTFVSDAMRSWPFFVLFLAQWVLWWVTQPPPGGWILFFKNFSDPFPYVFNGNMLAQLTFMDLILYGIAQRWQSARTDQIIQDVSQIIKAAAQMLKNQDSTMTALLALLKRDVELAEEQGEDADARKEILSRLAKKFGVDISDL